MHPGRRRFLKLTVAAALYPPRRAGPRHAVADGLIGLRWLARILYPQAFPEDLRPVVRDFYTRCHHRAPSEEQLDQLLRHA